MQPLHDPVADLPQTADDDAVIVRRGMLQWHSLRGHACLVLEAHAFERVRGERPVCITRLPFGWPEGVTRFSGPLDCIGYDGGGGIGSTSFVSTFATGVGAGGAVTSSGFAANPVICPPDCLVWRTMR